MIALKVTYSYIIKFSVIFFFQHYLDEEDKEVFFVGEYSRLHVPLGPSSNCIFSLKFFFALQDLKMQIMNSIVILFPRALHLITGYDTNWAKMCLTGK